MIPTTTVDGFSTALAGTVRQARRDQDLSTSTLADRSGVSRAMISRIERGDVQPTAALLGRLSAALGMTLSELVSRAEGTPGRLFRAKDQATWRDPDTGYVRRSVAPLSGGFVDLVEVRLPAGARVSYPPETYAFIKQLIWVLDGTLHFREGDEEYDLAASDCLELGPPAPCTFHNRTTSGCRYWLWRSPPAPFVGQC